MLNETVIFRATDQLAEAIQRHAETAGVTVSEYLRRIIAGAMEHQSIVSPVCAQLARAAFFSGEPSAFRYARCSQAFSGANFPDPMCLLPAAGNGDTDAQRQLADMAIVAALSGLPGVDAFLTLSEGLMFARLADRHDEIDDALRIVTMLALASTLTTGQAAMDMAGEAIARLEMIADSEAFCAESAADVLTNCAAHEHPDTLRVAQDYRARLTAKENV